jgi:phage terminase large subunit-like protein
MATMVDVRLRRAAADRLLMHAQTLTEPRWTPLPHQVPPNGDWYGWLLMAGRGAGKTDACARYVHEHVMGPPCLPGPVPHWVGIIAPTLGDAATSCYAGPSGLRVHSPEAKMTTAQGGTVIRWPNGSEAKIFGAHSPEDVERLRSGGNRCISWLEELAAWRYLDQTWDQIRFGLRSGPRPHWVASTTPKPRTLIKKLMAGDVANTVVTRATTYDNPHLPQDIREALEDAYGGTQIGRQELYAEVIDQDENALWSRAVLDAGRLRPDQVPPLMKKSVGVDPSGGRGEQGIVVVGKAMVEHFREVAGGLRPVQLAHGYVLADRTCHMSPDGWGRRVVQAAVDFEADDICVETNFGGDMALQTIRAAADAMGVPIPIKKVTATRGKKVRAEPVSALTEQGRWHMVGTFPELEDQMCTWYEDLDWSPDRLDAMVWPAWHLRIVKAAMTGAATAGGLVAATRTIG